MEHQINDSLTIVICDDREDRRQEWFGDIDAIPAVSGRLQQIEFDFEKFQKDLDELKQRRQQARPEATGKDRDPEPLGLTELKAREDPPFVHGGENMFDLADILVVDYALEKLEGEDAYLTGALVAYLARCYSSCRVIVGVNQHGENPFDLTLMGDRSSFADVDIGEEQLANRGLWEATEAPGFRPWSWPVVPDLVKLHERRVEEARSMLDRSVLEALGLMELVPLMPRSALQDLERQGTPVQAITFESVARTSALGLRRGEHPMSVDAIARIAAARIAKWLDTAVIPLQDVLIDAPHIAVRNSRLLAGSPESIDAWNATCKLGVPHDRAGLIEALEEHRYEHGLWATRPLWRWPGISNHDDLPGIADPWTISTSRFVFAEDLSRFVPRDQARRFVMEAGTNTTRWVADPTLDGFDYLEDVDYQPQRRLAM